MPDPRSILQQHWQYADFRPGQAEIIDSVLAGHDTLALLPTGGGKSVCFQVPALALGGVCLVVSPLIALMKDQVAQLRRRHLRAAALHAGMSRREIDITIDNAVHGHLQFLYLSPERLQTEIVRARAPKMPLRLLAVDEAHCISQWGYDFRPPYLAIADFRELVPDVPVIAVTATATERVKEDIQEKLAFRRGQVFQRSFARANLSYSVRDVEDKERKLREILSKVPGSSVVYVRSRLRAREVAEMLYREGVSASYYHAGLSATERDRRQQAWTAGQTRVIVATNAFGMGIDKPDVRTVVHLDLPDTLEAYFQEAGRAGRDGRRSYAVVLYHANDAAKLHERVAQSHPPPDLLRRVYQALANHYRLAVGSHELSSFDFDLTAFRQAYDLPPVPTYHALQELARCGLIGLSDQFYSPSKAGFLVDNQALYAFQVANRKLDPIVKMLLRLYGGELFTSLRTIQEGELARALRVPVAEVVAALKHLHQQEIICYEPTRDQPQLTFLTPRHAVSQLPLDVAEMRARYALDLSRVNAVVRYVTDARRCRTAMLLAYFGEQTDRRCGVCDHCLAARQVATDGAVVRQRVLELLRAAPCPPDGVVAQVPLPEAAVLQAVRTLLDEGTLRYDQAGRLHPNREPKGA